MVVKDFYTSGEYLEKNPDWHVEESPWKANAVLQMVRRNKIQPKTICEVGCGAGEILKILQSRLDHDCQFWGYEIAPQAYELAKSRENENLHFKLADFREEEGAYYDLVLIIDVLEHFEDPFSFLRQIKPESEYKILQLPLDVHVLSVLRNELIEFRHATGHLHFFTKDIALQIFKDNGYEVIDYFYTLPPFLDGMSRKGGKSNPLRLPITLLRIVKRSLQRLPRILFYAVDKDLAVRIFGGWRLVVLVK